MTDGPQDGEGEGTWTRLRRRKVVQWGIAYAAGAWGFLQGLEYATQTFHWPEQFQQLATLALLIGLPIVLVIAWFHGDRGHRRVSRIELALLTLLFLLGGGLFWRYQHTSETASVATPPALLAAAAVIRDDKSIAVLPFVNMSSDQEQEYFSDGLSEELLNLLAQVPRAARDRAHLQSFSFKGKEADIAEIAQQTQRRPRARRQRAQVRRHAAHHRAADPHRRQLAPVVADLRPPDDRRLQGAGRDRRRRGRRSSRSSCWAARRSPR